MTITSSSITRAPMLRRSALTLLLSSLSSIAVAAPAQPIPAAAPAAPAPAPDVSGTISTISVIGSQRIEPDTVRSYIKLAPGAHYDGEILDRALKDLYATDLFADVEIKANDGAIQIKVRENPVINRIVYEGNKRLKEDKIKPEVKLAPREIFTRAKVAADVGRIVELYRRQGRFAATVEPKIVQLDQNRVDLVFEINEGDKSRVQRINIIGNHAFSASALRHEMATKQTGITKILSSATSYDPDRLSYDQQKLRQFYLTNGYADFHVNSAVAELTPDKRDFVITYVVEEGQRYKFGDIDATSDIRDLPASTLKSLIPMKKGDWYNAKMVEDTVDRMSQTASLLGYASTDIRPDFVPEKDKRIMSVTFKAAEAPRSYIERIDINGNTRTRDQVVRREMRLAEGDVFNDFLVKRSRDRIQSLGFFQDKFEIEQKPGSEPGKVVLAANVQEKSTGELQVSAGYSSLEKFIVDLSIREPDFRGKGQELRFSASRSAYSTSVDVGFTEPYLFDKNIAIGADIFRRDYNSFSYVGSERRTTYDQVSTGFQVRLGVPLTEYWSLALRYQFSVDDVTLDKSTYYDDVLGNGVIQCDPVIAGRYLCDALGNRTTSSVGYSLVYDTRNNRIRPTAGMKLMLSQDLAGLGGSVRYLKTRAEADKYWNLGWGFTLTTSVEGGYINGLGTDVRLTDRFFLGSPQIRGFDIRGVGPRVIRTNYDISAVPASLLGGKSNRTDDALGGNAYYLGKFQIDLPTNAGLRDMGIRPSIFMDVGSVFDVKSPVLTTTAGCPKSGACTAITKQYNNKKGDPLYLDASGATTTVNTGTPYTYSITPFQETYAGDSPSPRMAVGFGVNWNSPFGPLEIDISKVLLKQKGDDTKWFNFNVGTSF